MLDRARARECVRAAAKLKKKKKKIKYQVRCRQLNHLANLRFKQNIEEEKKKTESRRCRRDDFEIVDSPPYTARA